MKKININILKQFRKDLETAITNDIMKGKSPRKHTIIAVVSLFSYIMFKPSYIYYMGYLDKKKKLAELKKKNEYVLN